MTIALSFGNWGGFYFHWKYTKRICLGWIAITFIPKDLDNVLGKEINVSENLKTAKEALLDIEKWDDDLEDIWDCPGVRAYEALKEINQA